MKRRRRLKLQLRRRLIALRLQRNQPAFPAASQKALHSSRFLAVPLVRTSLVARRKAHFHLRIDAPRMAGIWVQIVHAPPQQKQLKRLIRKPLRCRSRLKRPVSPIRLAQAGPIRNGNARVSVRAQIAYESRRAQMHPVQRLCPINLFQKRKLREQRLELRPRQPPCNPPHATRQLQPPRVLRRRLQQPFQPPAQIRRSPNVWFRVRLRPIQREHRSRVRQLCQRGLSISRIERQRLIEMAECVAGHGV